MLAGTPNNQRDLTLAHRSHLTPPCTRSLTAGATLSATCSRFKTFTIFRYARLRFVLKADGKKIGVIPLQHQPELAMLVGRNVMEGSQGPDILSHQRQPLVEDSHGPLPANINLLLRPLHAIGRNELIRLALENTLTSRSDSGLGRIARGKHHTGNPDTEAQSRGRMEPVGRYCSLSRLCQ
ncbi:MAG: hypothetical protein MRJ92_03310 [Nitrospira sp.]|nr:hypothetical protein [Nitrospira sp.]